MEPESGAAMRRDHLSRRERDELPGWVQDGALFLASLHREVRELEMAAFQARCRVQRAEAALRRQRARQPEPERKPEHPLVGELREWVQGR